MRWSAGRCSWFETAWIDMATDQACTGSVGRLLGARLPERAIRIGASVSFFVFAAIMIEAI